MRDRSPAPEETRCSRLLIVDEDPVFRLSFQLVLEQVSDLEVAVESEDGATALQILETRLAEPAAGAAATSESIDLVLLDIGLGRSNPSRVQGLRLCQRIRAQYPRLPVLLLGTSTEPLLLTAAQQAGASGYCLKSLDAAALIAALRQILAGEAFWQSAPAIQLAPASPPTRLDRLRRRWRLQGLQQIDSALAQVTGELQNPDLPLIDRAVLAGRRRELQTARRLIQWLLPTPAGSAGSRMAAAAEPPPLPSSSPGSAIQPAAQVQDSDLTLVQPADDRTLQAVLFDAVSAKLQGNLDNQTSSPLETDILRDEKKRELFYLILRKVEDLLTELRYSQVQPDQLPQKRSIILLDLWQSVTLDFFGRYYTVRLRNLEVELPATLLQDAALVQAAILDKIPLVTPLLEHLLFQAPLLVDSTPYAAGNPAALERAELLLEHLLIQVGNSVMQPLLNRFANLEAIKQNFYDRRLLSSREIERFRNDLSWKYRLERYLREPKAIFESQYELFAFSSSGIRQRAIYAPRNQELEQLSGVPLAITLALETRDAIAPRLRSAVSYLGNGFVYVLTEVIGRGLGLIGKGILKGIGQAVGEGRSNRR